MLRLVKDLSKDNLEIVSFENYDSLMKELNNKNIDYGITYENYFHRFSIRSKYIRREYL